MWVIADRRLLSSQMNDEHFNYKKTTPHGAYYKTQKERDYTSGRRTEKKNNKKKQEMTERKPLEAQYTR